MSTAHPVFETVVPDNQTGDPLFGESGLAFLLQATREALAQSGRDPAELAGTRVGVCVGSSVGFAINHFPLYQAYKYKETVAPERLALFRRSNYAQALKDHLRLTGPCQLVANACASGTDAIGVGASWVRSGLCDLVVAAGAESLSCISYLGFIRLMVADQTPCKPFDRDRAGLNLGEGAGVLLLEPLSTSRPVLGRILGYGAASDAYHPTAPHPQGMGLRRAYEQALAQAGVKTSEVAFINVHGTGTRDNDKVESLVLADMFPEALLLATKGATGHALGAAGAIEAAITLECLRQGIIPPSPGFRVPDPDLLVSPMSEPVRFKNAVAISNSLAFGGCNAALVLEGVRQ